MVALWVGATTSPRGSRMRARPPSAEAGLDQLTLEQRREVHQVGGGARGRSRPRRCWRHRPRQCHRQRSDGGIGALAPPMAVDGRRRRVRGVVLRSAHGRRRRLWFTGGRGGAQRGLAGNLLHSSTSGRRGAVVRPAPRPRRRRPRRGGACGGGGARACRHGFELDRDDANSASR